MTAIDCGLQPMTTVPAIRVAPANTAKVRTDGEFVLYWMIANRRAHANFALDRAVEWATKLGKPLVVFEALRCDYPWASDRLHRFVLEGMAANADAFAKTPAFYYPYVEPIDGDDHGMLDALADRAAVIITDDFPCYFLPRMVRAFATRAPVLVETVDANGIFPLRASERDFPTAFAFRRVVQRELVNHVHVQPLANALARDKIPRLERLPSAITRRWPATNLSDLEKPDQLVAKLPIDHCVKPAVMPGGEFAARKALKNFIARQFDRYAEDRNEPDEDASSGLSPYLHFGHISAHEAFRAVLDHEQTSLDEVSERAAKQKPTGKREGWWGLSPAAEGFLDQLITWRELGYHFAFHRPDYARYSSLPDWAKATLAKHARDVRPNLYDLATLESAATHDKLWNAAQRQLVREGRLHNYLRMLWGKKILEWSPTPEEALDRLIHLNNKYAVDGRNPNSYSGIFWTLGRFDRAWGPVRPIFGTIRYMSSENTARKVSVKTYLEKYA
jgi:deoxyribodipyrimidine photo-lyase